jgi:hypothetical protein
VAEIGNVPEGAQMHSGVQVVTPTAAFRMNKQSVEVGFGPPDTGCEQFAAASVVVVVELVVVPFIVVVVVKVVVVTFIVVVVMIVVVVGCIVVVTPTQPTSFTST